ncbi:MAG: sigma-70 family RNA polymerase sigma factor [Mesonia sp.]|uniref:RNA polymerase sigma factor n=1 Tax=Mesonia sp. TaxID=1960830 RepID=UPI0032420903
MQTHFYTQLQLGKSEALEFWYQRYARMLFYIGHQWLKDDFVVENLVQECFLKLWQNRERLENPKHIFFFLRLVMKRECISHYHQPKHQFQRSIHRLEEYEHYNDYLLKDDPALTEAHQQQQAKDQQTFESVQKVLPLLSGKQQDLIELCLAYGFEYKVIARLTGSSTTAVYREVQRAIAQLQKILRQDAEPEEPIATKETKQVSPPLTQTQVQVWQLRCEEQRSFAEIAEQLGTSTKEVQQQFSLAYQYTQQHPQETLTTVR